MEFVIAPSKIVRILHDVRAEPQRRRFSWILDSNERENSQSSIQDHSMIPLSPRRASTDASPNHKPPAEKCQMNVGVESKSNKLTNNVVSG
jgi:hypothetical protein